MPKLKVLSGKEVLAILGKFGFLASSQKGSHIKLKRILGGISQILTIPNHHELDRGTLKAIFNQAGRFISVELLQKEFYTK